VPDPQDVPGRRKTKSRLTFALVLVLVLGAAGSFYWIVSARFANAGENGAAGGRNLSAGNFCCESQRQ